MSDQNWLSNYHDHKEGLILSIDILANIVYDLRKVGFSQLATNISDVVALLEQSTQGVDSAISQHIDEQFKEADQSFFNTFKAIFGSIADKEQEQ